MSCQSREPGTMPQAEGSREGKGLQLSASRLPAGMLAFMAGVGRGWGARGGFKGAR